MATEDVIILKVGTDEAVKSVGDLRNNIKELKKQINGYTEVVEEDGKKVKKTFEGLTIGSDEYKQVLEELKINQNALRDAMYATTASLEDVAAAAQSTNVQWDENNKLVNKGNISYNELVHTMAALKEEWRATSDAARRAELGEQIEQINTQLKGMDASVGNFQRNVGNYESGVSGLVAKFDAWGTTLKQMPPTLGAAKESIGKVGETMQLVGKQPILGIIGLLAPIIMKITDSLKDNETAMDAVKKLMESLQPIFDVFSGVLETIAQGLSNAVEWLVQFVGESDGIKNVVSSIMGVGNSILQYLLAPIKSAVAAFKGLGKIIGDVFKGDWSEIKTHAKETGQEIADAYKEGFSFKSNFDVGKTSGADFINGVKDNKESAKEAGKEVASSFKEGYDEVLEQIKAENAEWADEQRALAEEEADIEMYSQQMAAEEEFQEWQTERMWEGVNARLDAAEEAKNREIQIKEEEAAILKEIEDKKEEDAKKAAEQRIATMSEVANATSGLLSSMADMYESDEKNSEKNAKKIKALRIASATIDMLNGAVMAYSSAQTLGPPAGPIVGAANAAAVIAMGIANINKIKSTNFSGGGSSSATASVNPPAVDTNIPTMRTATSASEEDRLNRMASPQKVYILQSDIEAAGSQSKTQIEESSF